MDHDTVIAAFDSATDAQSAISALTSAGIPRSSIEMQPTSDSTTQTGSTAGTEEHHEGGIGHFFRSLFGMEDDYKQQHDTYAESVRRGHYVVTVHAQDERQLDQAVDVLNRFNPVDIDQRAEHWKSQGWTGYDPAAPMYSTDEVQRERSSYSALAGSDTRNAGAAGTTANEQRIPVVEEQIQVGKRAVQRGGVRVFQRVREVPVSERVNLREEHVNVQRQPVDRPASEADFAALKDGKAVELTETAEEAVVGKSARVVEEVVVGKEVRERTEEVKDTVRRTEVEVEQLGATDTGRTNIDDADYRKHWQSTYGTSGGRYEDYDAAYRYGSTVAGNDQYKNYRWEDVEPQARSDWESNHPGSAWEKVKDAVRYGAERVTGNRRH